MKNATLILVTLILGLSVGCSQKQNIKLERTMSFHAGIHASTECAKQPRGRLDGCLKIAERCFNRTLNR
jgi:hypothetical protein